MDGSEAVLLGAAILGAVAARAGRVIEPAGGQVRRFHDATYAVHRRMHEDQQAYRALMESGET